MDSYDGSDGADARTLDEPHRLPEAGITTGLYPDAEANKFCCPSPDEENPDPSPEPKPEVRLDVSPDRDGSDPNPEPMPEVRPESPKPPENPDGGGLSE
jgi:hypothetical protein